MSEQSSYRKEPSTFESVISLVLRYGVIISFSTITFGCLLLFAEGQTGYYSLPSDSGQLLDMRDLFLIGPAPLIQGLLSLKPYAIIDAGLVVLLATPLARVAVSIPLFATERRFVFVLITAVVLAILLLSMLIIAPMLTA